MAYEETLGVVSTMILAIVFRAILQICCTARAKRPHLTMLLYLCVLILLTLK